MRLYAFGLIQINSNVREVLFFSDKYTEFGELDVKMGFNCCSKSLTEILILIEVVICKSRKREVVICN